MLRFFIDSTGYHASGWGSGRRRVRYGMTFHHSMGMVITPNAPVVFRVEGYPDALRSRARAAYSRGQTAFDAGEVSNK